MLPQVGDIWQLTSLEKGKQYFVLLENQNRDYGGLPVQRWTALLIGAGSIENIVWCNSLGWTKVA